MESRTREFGPEDALCLDAQRKWLIRHYAPGFKNSYEDLDAKLDVLQSILAAETVGVDPHRELKLQCMGTCFGDALAQCLGMEWVIYEDGEAREPALSLGGTPILVFPLSMITRQVEDGEVVSIRDLFESTCRKILDIKNKMVPHQ